MDSWLSPSLRQWNGCKVQTDASLSIILHPSDHFPACTCTTITHTQWNSISNNFHNSNTRFFIVSNRWWWPSEPVACAAPGAAPGSCVCVCARACMAPQIGQLILSVALFDCSLLALSCGTWKSKAPPPTTTPRFQNKMLTMPAAFHTQVWCPRVGTQTRLHA